MSPPNATDPPASCWLIADEPEPDGWPADVAFLRHVAGSLNTSLTECAAEEQVTAGVSDEAIGRYLDGLEGKDRAHPSSYGHRHSPSQLPRVSILENPESEHHARLSLTEQELCK